MNPNTQEWVDRAEKYWDGLERYLFLYKQPNAVLGREHRGRTAPHYGAAVMMARDCAKEYLIAKLAEAKVDVIRRHDIVTVMDQVLTVQPDWNFLRPIVEQLEYFVNGYRFPEEPLDRDNAKEARRLCALIRQTLRPSLGLPL